MNTIQFEIPLTWMRVDTAAAYLGLSPRTINRYRLNGRIPAYKLSERTWLYCREDLDDFASRQITIQSQPSKRGFASETVNPAPDSDK